MLKELTHPSSAPEETARLARLGVAADVGRNRSVKSIKVYVDRRPVSRPLGATDAIGREEVIVPRYV